MKKTAFLTAALLLSCLSAPAWADDDYIPGSTHPSLDVGVLFGGDKLAERKYVVGGTDSVYAGKSVFADVGILHNFDDPDWAFKGTVGIQSGFSAGFGSDINFKRYPVDLVVLYSDGNQHFGAGLTYHANPKLNGNGHVPDLTFKDAVGAVLEYQYRVFGVRYTNIRYRIEGPCTGRCSFDGSTLGLFFNFVF
ncbi:MAG TPA: hypothetical protein VLV87_01960 [Gammaproteobacteria bacterium]|nr:hypothetical protein [Gammaproteobacteria bacterium]